MHSTNTCKIERKSEMEVVLEWKSEMGANLEWKSEIEVRNKRVEVEDPSQPPYGRSRILFQYSIPVVQYSSPVFHRIKTPLYNEYKTALRQRCVLYCFVVGVYYIFYANYVVQAHPLLRQVSSSSSISSSPTSAGFYSSSPVFHSCSPVFQSSIPPN